MIAFSTRVFCMSVSCFLNGCPCSVLTVHNHLSSVCESTFCKSILNYLFCQFDGVYDNFTLLYSNVVNL